MRKIIAYPITYLLYHIGNWISILDHKMQGEKFTMYPMYNWLMLTSISVQEWGNLSQPWEDVISEKDQVIFLLKKMKKQYPQFTIRYQYDTQLSEVVSEIHLIQVIKDDKILGVEEIFNYYELSQELDKLYNEFEVIIIEEDSLCKFDDNLKIIEI